VKNKKLAIPSVLSTVLNFEESPKNSKRSEMKIIDSSVKNMTRSGEEQEKILEKHKPLFMY